MPSARQVRGADGERAAARWYEDHGYEVLDRNWRCREGELDLVLGTATTLVFCEVKTRTNDRFGTPAEAVTPRKRAKVRQVARRYLEATDRRAASLRFDVASVRPGGEVEVITGAF